MRGEGPHSSIWIIFEMRNSREKSVSLGIKRFGHYEFEM